MPEGSIAPLAADTAVATAAYPPQAPFELAPAADRLDPAIQPIAIAAIAPYGPAEPQDVSTGDQRVSFGTRVGAVKWEILGAAAYLTAINLPRVIHHPDSFDFEDEGWFGTSTPNIGVDKVAHAYNAYLISEAINWRMSRKLGHSTGNAVAAGLVTVGLETYSELFDGFEKKGGFSWQDITFDFAGAGFSILRNTVPGLKDKLDFRLLYLPHHHLLATSGKNHFRQERFVMALTLAGFEGLKRTPLRFVELQAGYYASGFTDDEQRDGDRRRRRPFVGIALNLQQLLFPSGHSTVDQLGRTFLDYVQPPYTGVYKD